MTLHVPSAGMPSREEIATLLGERLQSIVLLHGPIRGVRLARGLPRVGDAAARRSSRSWRGISGGCWAAEARASSERAVDYAQAARS